jgi:uncharacterized protein involved in exopolysaccharide biosynthesis
MDGRNRSLADVEGRGSPYSGPKTSGHNHRDTITDAMNEDMTENLIRRAVQCVWDRRKRIVQFVSATTLIAFGLTFLQPEMYRAETTLLPDVAQSKSSVLGGLADIAAAAGVSTSEGKITKLYPTILSSETILRTALTSPYVLRSRPDSIDLYELWGLDKSNPERAFERALQLLRARLDANVDFRTDVVSVTVVMEYPDLAAQILNRLVEAMDRFLRESRRTNASEQRTWIGTRLKEVKGDLEKSENTLKEFREKNRRIADSPQLLLEQDRLLRQVEINSSVFIELTKQYEIAKIEELRNIPLVNVLDMARPPVVKDRPKRVQTTVVAFLVSTFVAIFAVVVWKQFGSQIKQLIPQTRASIKRG